LLLYSYRFDELAEAPAHKIDQIRDSVRKMIGQIRKDTTLGDVLDDEIHLKKPETFHFIVQQLSNVSFKDSTHDLKGRSFRVFCTRQFEAEGVAAGAGRDAAPASGICATGITAYLQNGGTLEKAQQIACHESRRARRSCTIGARTP
jgi:hypothetical protein